MVFSSYLSISDIAVHSFQHRRRQVWSPFSTPVCMQVSPVLSVPKSAFHISAWNLYWTMCMMDRSYIVRFFSDFDGIRYFSKWYVSTTIFIRYTYTHVMFCTLPIFRLTWWIIQGQDMVRTLDNHLSGVILFLNIQLSGKMLIVTFKQPQR